MGSQGGVARTETVERSRSTVRAAVNAVRKARGLEEYDPIDFLDVLEERLKMIGWDDQPDVGTFRFSRPSRRPKACR